MKVSPAKAVVAGVIAFLGALTTGLTDDTLTAAEWVFAALSGVSAFGGTYWAPRYINNDPPTQ